jgi:hypothetical protein
VLQEYLTNKHNASLITVLSSKSNSVPITGLGQRNISTQKDIYLAKILSAKESNHMYALKKDNSALVMEQSSWLGRVSHRTQMIPHLGKRASIGNILKLFQ